jgi:hypothetical protein
MHLAVLVLLLLGGCSGVNLPGSPPPTQQTRTYCYETKQDAPPTVVPCPSATSETGKAPVHSTSSGGL